MRDIKLNSENYLELIETIKNTDITNNCDKYISLDKLPNSIIEKLVKTKIKRNLNYIVISKIESCTDIKIEFIVGKLHLEYYSCSNSDFPKPDSYLKEGFIETFGIDKNWCLWIDNDFI